MDTPDNPTPTAKRRQTSTHPRTINAIKTCNAAIHGPGAHLMIAIAKEHHNNHLKKKKIFTFYLFHKTLKRGFFVIGRWHRLPLHLLPRQKRLQPTQGSSCGRHAWHFCVKGLLPINPRNYPPPPPPRTNTNDSKHWYRALGRPLSPSPPPPPPPFVPPPPSA